METDCELSFAREQEVVVYIPSGIYRCDIETTAVHSTDNTRETVYVGLYNSGGEHAITF